MPCCGYPDCLLLVVASTEDISVLLGVSLGKLFTTRPTTHVTDCSGQCYRTAPRWCKRSNHVFSSGPLTTNILRSLLIMFLGVGESLTFRCEDTAVSDYLLFAKVLLHQSASSSPFPKG